MSAKFTSWLATVAPAVMKPAWRPISFTRPMPPATLRASVCAQSSTRAASSIALKKPKVRETKPTSLSIVLGTPTTESGVATFARFLEEVVSATLGAITADGEKYVYSRAR